VRKIGAILRFDTIAIWGRVFTFSFADVATLALPTIVTLATVIVGSVDAYTTRWAFSLVAKVNTAVFPCETMVTLASVPAVAVYANAVVRASLPGAVRVLAVNTSVPSIAIARVAGCVFAVWFQKVIGMYHPRRAIHFV